MTGPLLCGGFLISGHTAGHCVGTPVLSARPDRFPPVFGRQRTADLVNQINPQKRAGSKWTAVQPAGRAQHFQVPAEPPTGDHYVIEPALTSHRYRNPRPQFQNEPIWTTGWQLLLHPHLSV